MTEQTAGWLQKALQKLEEECGDELGVTLRDNYSGRGMMGRRCHALVGSLGNIMMLTGQAAVLASQESDLELETLLCELGGANTDSMGRDLVIY